LHIVVIHEGAMNGKHLFPGAPGRTSRPPFFGLD
jgi:hypothetical protein